MGDCYKPKITCSSVSIQDWFCSGTQGSPCGYQSPQVLKSFIWSVWCLHLACAHLPIYCVYLCIWERETDRAHVHWSISQMPTTSRTILGLNLGTIYKSLMKVLWAQLLNPSPVPPRALMGSWSHSWELNLGSDVGYERLNCWARYLLPTPIHFKSSLHYW